METRIILLIIVVKNAENCNEKPYIDRQFLKWYGTYQYKGKKLKKTEYTRREWVDSKDRR